MADFDSLPVQINVAMLGISAAIVWFAGNRLGMYCKLLAERTRAGQAIIGTVLLGSVVSLTEMTMAATAAWREDTDLAVNTLLGGIALALLTLAITDAVAGKEPLSSDIVRPVVLLQGTLVILLLVVAGAGIVVSDSPLFGAGLWTTALAVLYLLFLILIDRYQKSRSWVPDSESNTPKPHIERQGVQRQVGSRPGKLIFPLAAASLAVMAGGSIAALAADGLAEQTQLGASFIGFVLGGIVTTLPEVSATIAAVRLGQYEMAFGDVFGTNLFSVMFLFVVDLIYPGGPILREVGPFALLAILLGISVTAVYVSGLIARPKRSILGMGIDSVLVICISAAGLVLLYRFR